jgi:hypothetical protein
MSYPQGHQNELVSRTEVYKGNKWDKVTNSRKIKVIMFIHLINFPNYL